jgi:hypothetical protein
MRLTLGASMGLVASVLLGLACGGGQTNLYKGNIHSSSAAYAGANVAVGAALYVAAGGCKISGCPTNTQCNHVTERCDPVKCGTSTCKGDEACDEASGHCLPISLAVTKPSPSTNTPPVPTPINVNAGANALP